MFITIIIILIILMHILKKRSLKTIEKKPNWGSACRTSALLVAPVLYTTLMQAMTTSQNTQIIKALFIANNTQWKLKL